MRLRGGTIRLWQAAAGLSMLALMSHAAAHGILIELKAPPRTTTP